MSGTMDEEGPAPAPPARSGGRERSVTYAAWLDLQTGRRDGVGWLARAFVRAGQEGDRSRLSGVAGITRWWRDNPSKIAIEAPDDLEQAIGQARSEFLAWQAALSLPPPDHAPDLQEQPSSRHPAPGGEAADTPRGMGGAGGTTAGVSGSPGSSGEILSVIYGQLSRIEGWLPQLGGQLAPMVSKLDEVLAWQRAQDARLAPLMRLIEDLQAAEEAEGQAAGNGDDPALPPAGGYEGPPPAGPGGGSRQPPQGAQPWAGPGHDVAGDVRAAMGRAYEEGGQPPGTSDMPDSSPVPPMPPLYDPGPLRGDPHAPAWPDVRDEGAAGLHGGHEERRHEDPG